MAIVGRSHAESTIEVGRKTREGEQPHLVESGRQTQSRCSCQAQRIKSFECQPGLEAKDSFQTGVPPHEAVNLDFEPFG